MPIKNYYTYQERARTLYIFICTRNIYTKFQFSIAKQKSALFHLRETFAAINGSVRTRQEWDFRFLSTTCACCDVHFSLGLPGIFSYVAAVFASLGLVLESLFRVKLLVSDSKYEFLSAVFAYDGFVLIHDNTSLLVL